MKNNMKKFLLLFCMLACVFSMTACSQTTTTVTSSKSGLVYDEATLQTNVVSILQQMSDSTNEEITNELENATGVSDGFTEFYNNWMKSREELGEFVEVTDFTSSSDKETVSMSLTVQYSNRECGVEIAIDTEGDVVSSTFNPVYTTGEKMEKALLNTLLGMGTVFIVLIFISFIISMFKYISVFENKMKAKKEENAENTASQGVDNAIAQIVQNEAEDEVDDCELVAAISAAIAAFEGTSADGLVVRSIKRVNKNRR